jgi:hypothetical protein
MTKNRDTYTWDDAAHDLALNTHLTLSEAATVTKAIAGTTHPYDATPPLLRFFSGESPIGVRATALKDLIAKFPYPDGDGT